MAPSKSSDKTSEPSPQGECKPSISWQTCRTCFFSAAVLVNKFCDDTKWPSLRQWKHFVSSLTIDLDFVVDCWQCLFFFSYSGACVRQEWCDERAVVGFVPSSLMACGFAACYSLVVHSLVLINEEWQRGLLPHYTWHVALLLAARLQAFVIFLWGSGARDFDYVSNKRRSGEQWPPKRQAMRNKGASLLVPWSFAARKIRIARSTISKKNNNCSQSSWPLIHHALWLSAKNDCLQSNFYSW